MVRTLSRRVNELYYAAAQCVIHRRFLLHFGRSCSVCVLREATAVFHKVSFAYQRHTNVRPSHTRSLLFRDFTVGSVLVSRAVIYSYDRCFPLSLRSWLCYFTFLLAFFDSLLLFIFIFVV